MLTPLASAYVPLGLAMHTVIPAVAVYAPVGQGWHTDAFVAFAVAEDVPAGQSVTALAPMPVYAPAGFTVHAVLPGVAENEPAGHG
jgi:hypothetical protein